MKKAILAITAAITLMSTPTFANSDTEQSVPEYVFNSQVCEDEHTVNDMPSFVDVPVLSKELDLLVRLNALEGYEDNTLNLDKTITRAEATKMLCYAVNNKYRVKDIEKRYSKEGLEQTQKEYMASGMEYKYDGFSDVSLYDWYHPYVYSLKSTGFIDGYEDGTFRPENEVTEIEFLTVLEKSLGYTHMIEAEGGYPNGVISIANNLNLIDNPSPIPTTRKRAAEMIYNALNAHVVLITGFAVGDTGSIEQQFSMDKTLLQYRGMYKVHGTLKKSNELSDKTVVFVPDEDINNNFFSVKKDKEYTFAKEYSDITEGEFDVYIDTNGEFFTVISIAK